MVSLRDDIFRWIEHFAGFVDKSSTQDHYTRRIGDIVKKQLREDDDPRTVEDALKRLANMCLNEHEQQIRKEIGLQGGPLAIVKAMEKYQGDAIIQAWCLCALGKVACGNAENKRDSCDLGAVKIAVDAMSKFPDVEFVQSMGSLFLGIVSFGPGANAGLVGDAGGIRAVARAMKDFPGSASLQSRACPALESMAKASEEMKLKVVRAGGTVLIGKVLKDHYDNPDVAQPAGNALKALIPSTTISLSTKLQVASVAFATLAVFCGFLSSRRGCR